MQQRRSGGGAFWFVSINPAPVDMQLPGEEGHGLVQACPTSTVGPALQSLRPHLSGGGEENGDTPVSPPWTRCHKPLCLSHPHFATGTNEAVCVVLPSPAPWRLAAIQTLTLPALVPGKRCSALPDMWSLAGGCKQALSCPTALQGGDRFFLLQTAPLTSPLSPGLASLHPRCAIGAAGPSQEKTPRLEIESFSTPVRVFCLVQIQSYASLASLSLLFVSPQKGISPLHSFYLSQFAIMHLWPIRLSQWVPRCDCLFVSQTLRVQSPLASTLLSLRDKGLGTSQSPYFSAMLVPPLSL